MPVVAKGQERRPRWVRRGALAFLTALAVLAITVVGMLWMASFRPIAFRGGEHGFWLGTRGVPREEFDCVDIVPGRYYVILPVPDDQWIVGEHPGLVCATVFLAATGPSPRLTCFKIGAVRYAFLIW